MNITAFVGHVSLGHNASGQPPDSRCTFPTTGNILYLYLLCMNFTLHRGRNENFDLNKPKAVGTYVDHDASQTYAQLLHDKTVELMRQSPNDNDDDDETDDTFGARTSFVAVHTVGDIDALHRTNYWRESDRLTPFTNYLLHRSNELIRSSPYHASDAYVRWFCAKLEGSSGMG